MRKTLTELADYLQTILVPETDEKYTIQSTYQSVSDEETLREGIRGYRTFLNHLFKELSLCGDMYDSHKKVAHEYENRTTLSGYYPFLHAINNLLIRIGYYGVFDKNNSYLICEHNIFNEKIPVSKTMECLRFLNDCGMEFEGINLDEKKLNLSDIETIKVSYSDNPVMLIGMKVMAIAEVDYRTLINQDVFLRCDYSVLKNDETDVIIIIRNTIRTLPVDIQNFVLQLHQRYLDKGMKCVVEIKGFHVYVKYMYKRKELWGINASLNNGFHINVKTQKMDQYTDVIETFPPFLREIINEGYGCGRKIESIGHCNGGCRGMTIPLDSTVLIMSNDIKNWFDAELEYL